MSLLIFPDPEVEARKYLLPLLEPMWPKIRVGTKVPDLTDWQAAAPQLVVLTATGPGSRTGVVYEQILLGVETFMPTKGEASKVSRYVRAFLEDWPNQSGQVAGFDDNARPAESTNPETGYPAYWYSCSFLLKGQNG